MKCSNKIPKLGQSTCMPYYNHLNVLSIGEVIEFTDKEGNKIIGKIIDIKRKGNSYS